MSRFILWEKPTLKGAVESANTNIKISILTYNKFNYIRNE